MEKNKLNRRFYVIILSQIPTSESDNKFGKILEEHKFEWWRYTAFNWILVTPNNVSTNQILTYVLEAYEAQFTVAMEVSINDIGGIFPMKKEEFDKNHIVSPLTWFYKVRDPNYKTKWERNEDANK